MSLMRMLSAPRVLYLIKILVNIKEYSRPLLAGAETSDSKKICLRFDQKRQLNLYECGFLVFVVFHMVFMVFIVFFILRGY